MYHPFESFKSGALNDYFGKYNDVFKGFLVLGLLHNKDGIPFFWWIDIFIFHNLVRLSLTCEENVKTHRLLRVFVRCTAALKTIVLFNLTQSDLEMKLLTCIRSYSPGLEELMYPFLRNLGKMILEKINYALNTSFVRNFSYFRGIQELGWVLWQNDHCFKQWLWKWFH